MSPECVRIAISPCAPRAREQQARDVAAGDEEYEPNRAQKHDERPADVTDDDLAVRHQPEPPRFVLRVCLLELSRDAVHLTLRLGNRDARREAAETAQEVEAAYGRLVCAERDRPPHLHVDHAVEERRQDADDGVRASVDGDAGAEDARVLPEALLPESVRDDDDVGAPAPRGPNARPRIGYAMGSEKK